MRNWPIEKIGELNITPNKIGNCADFKSCALLKTAEGTFPGHLNFSGSGIEQVGELHVHHPNENQESANLKTCPRLRRVPDRILNDPYEK